MTEPYDATKRLAAPTAPDEFRAVVYESIADIPTAGLDKLIPGEPESWDYYRAIEDIPPPGFQLGGLAVEHCGSTVALAPLFRTRYRLDTPLQGGLRRITDWLHHRTPGLTSLSVLGLGSPMSDNLTIGFAPGIGPEGRARAFDAMLRKLRAEATDDRRQVVAIKSIDDLALEMAPVLAEHDFNCVTSVPLAMLDLPFGSLDEYLASLRPKTARYLKRKYRTAAQLRMEYITRVEPFEKEINELFRNTLAQSAVSYGDFQELDPSYFQRVKSALGDRSQIMLCWHGSELVSFQTFIYAGNRIVAKQIGMKYPAARDLNLYFINWLELIKFAIAHRIRKVEMGATTYATKLLFGGYLERRTLHFRFRREISNTIFRPLAPLFDFEGNDPELKKLDDKYLRTMRGS
ncbi:MAG: hypothetical protein RLZ98_578 [Pseudomonadota bacterium]|jgi:hypothetical protein